MNKRARRIAAQWALAAVVCALTAEPALALPGEPPTPGNPPTIGGTARWGDTLSSTNGTFTPALLTEVYQLHRQWYQCNSAGAGCAPITGATAVNYTVVGADVGKRLRVATAANSRDTATQLIVSPFSQSNFSAPTNPVVANPPNNLSLPTFSGTARFGKALTRGSLGSWNSPTPTSYLKQWVRCDAKNQNCAAIPGATSDSYTLGEEDLGRRIRLRVSARGPFGTGQADSAPSRVVVTDIDSTPADDPTTPEADPTKLKPFPKIIVAGTLRGPGVIISDFIVKGQKNVKVKIRCRGFSCPYARRTFTKRKRRTHIRSLERPFFAGVKLEIRIVKKGRIGKYTRVRIRAGKAPKRVDRCVYPGVKKPRKCP